MFRIVFVVSLIVVLFSCKRSNNSNGDHLSPAVMQKVLLDVNMAEAYSINMKDSLHKMGSKNIDSLSAFYKRIFDHYKITEAEFNNSLQWYKDNPSELDSIYAKLIPIVTKLQARMPPVPAQALPAPQNTPTQMAHPVPARIDPNINAGAPNRPAVFGKKGTIEHPVKK